MDNKDMMTGPPLSVLTENIMGKTPLLSPKPGMTAVETERINRLRTAFTPVILTLLERELITPDSVADPSTLIKTLIEQGPDKGLNIEPELMGQLNKLLDNNIDWPKEAVNISLQGEGHPLTKLIQIITPQLSERAREELTRLSL